MMRVVGRFLRHVAPALGVVLISACSGNANDGDATTSSSHGGAGGSGPTATATGSTTSPSTSGTAGNSVGGNGVGGNGVGGNGVGGNGIGGGGGAGGADECSVDGNPGDCVDTSVCAELADHTSTPGYCPGPDNIQCCVVTPNVADNPPIPTGYKPMMQDEVTTEMTAWAVDILHDPTGYPMFSTATQTFGTLMVLARVEWHPPDFQNGVVHRGVTLYEPI